MGIMESAASPTPRVRYSARRPFAATVVEHRLLSKSMSRAEVWHVELDIAGSGMDLHPGDSVGVIAPAQRALVAGVLATLGLTGDEPSPIAGMTLRTWLTETRELSIPSAKLLRLAGDQPPVKADPGLTPVPDVLDLLVQLAGAGAPVGLLSTLRPIQPRAYSVSSSALESPDRLALTVARLSRNVDSRERMGASSSVLTGHTLDDAPHGAHAVGIFPIPGAHFRLPQDDRPIVMIAAGTGIAPFRGFLRERRLRAGGPAWLFFGQRAAGMGAWEDECSVAIEEGLLQRASFAYSSVPGDGPRYVQEALTASGGEVADWIDAGAAIYVCGKDALVDSIPQVLAAVLREHRGLSTSASRAAVDRLVAEDRFRTDSFTSAAV